MKARRTHVKLVDLAVEPLLDGSLHSYAVAVSRRALLRGESYPAIVVDAENRVLDGKYVVLAARELGWAAVDCLRIERS